MGGFSRLAIIALLIVVSSALVWGIILSRHGKEEKMARNTATAAAIPAIDTVTTTRTETATFALG